MDSFRALLVAKLGQSSLLSLGLWDEEEEIGICLSEQLPGLEFSTVEPRPLGGQTEACKQSLFGGDEDPHPCRGCGLRCTRGPLRARDCHHVVVPGLWGPSPTPDGTVVLCTLNTPAARCYLRERTRVLLLTTVQD